MTTIACQHCLGAGRVEVRPAGRPADDWYEDECEYCLGSGLEPGADDETDNDGETE